MNTPIVVLLVVIVLAAAAIVALVVYRVRARREKHRLTDAVPPVSSAPEGTQQEDPAAGIRTRLMGLGGVTGALFGVLLVRLWGMQLIEGDSYTEQSDANRTREVGIRAPRGRILDRQGRVLVGNRQSMALVATSDVADNVRVVRRLSNLLGAPDVCIRRAIQSSAQGAQSLRTIAIDVPESAVAYVVEHSEQFPGVEVESQWVRQYPHGSLAAHVLGYAGEISTDELASFNADENSTITYVSGDIVGKSGVELAYESVLQGVRGVRTVHVDANGNVTGIVSEVDPVQGSDVRLTIDLDVQAAAESAIQHAMEAARVLNYAPTGGAIVALDCKTGAVLAMASYPTFDPTSFVSGISSEMWRSLQDESAHTPLLNRAVNGLYPPASTVKPLTALAGIDEGVASYDSTYYCNGWWTGLGEAFGKWCWAHEGHQSVSLERGIEVSCDVVFYEIAKAVYYSSDPEAIQEMFRKWGLGAATGIDLSGESIGRVPDAQWKWDWFTWADDADRIWQAGDTANIAIGQGDMLVTPLQIACLYAAFANGGTLLRPHILDAVASAQTGDVVATAMPSVRESVDVSADDLAFIRDALLQVVNGEEGLSVYFSNLSVSVAGKSGTGEAGDDPVNPHSWFCAYAPADDPQYVVASLIEHGGTGSYTGASACEEVFAAIWGAPVNDYVQLNIEHGAVSNTGTGVGA